MNLDQQVRAFGGVPFSHGSLLPLLQAYKRPNDKIARWLAEGQLVQLRRGLYVLGKDWRAGGFFCPCWPMRCWLLMCRWSLP